jgi:hypothetical protein
MAKKSSFFAVPVSDAIAIALVNETYVTFSGYASYAERFFEIQERAKIRFLQEAIRCARTDRKSFLQNRLQTRAAPLLNPGGKMTRESAVG